MSSETLLKVEQLSREYGALRAVDHISFELKRGEVLGFLGPNGAGKSTSMQMITGNLAPSTGSVTVNNIDLLERPKQAKAHIGYLPEQPPVYRELTVDEYLRFCARINNVAKSDVTQAVANAKQRCGLAEAGHRLIGNLSKGYQQRVGIAQAIVHAPAIVILDEPTVGLDPIQIREIRQLIRELGDNHSVILSTHILPEVQMTCDRVQIIHQGKLIFSDSIANLNQQTDMHSCIIGLSQLGDEQQLKQLASVDSIETLGQQRWRLNFSAQQNSLTHIAEAAVSNNWGLTELTPEIKTLEQIFVDITSVEPDTATAEDSVSGVSA